MAGEEQLLPISWFQWIVSGLIAGFLIVTGALWNTINRQRKRIDTLENAIIAQGERFNRDLKEALAAFAIQDASNDDLRIGVISAKIDSVRSDYGHLESEMHRMESRITQNTNQRQASIESTMSDGFSKVIGALRDSK